MHYYKKKIKNYNILVIQKLEQYYIKTKIYNFNYIDFTLVNNKKYFCFYINKCINNNS